MANGHLQRDESAIAITEYDGIAIAASLAYHFSHSVSDSNETSGHGIRASEARQLGNDHPERARQTWNDGIEARAIRQQRVKQEKRRPVAGLRRVDRAVGEKSIHASQVFPRLRGFAAITFSRWRPLPARDCAAPRPRPTPSRSAPPPGRSSARARPAGCRTPSRRRR